MYMYTTCTAIELKGALKKYERILHERNKGQSERTLMTSARAALTVILFTILSSRQLPSYVKIINFDEYFFPC